MRSSSHVAGRVTAIPAAGPSSRSATRSTTQRTSHAVSSSGAHGSPASSIGTSSPIRPGNPRTTRSGSPSAHRSAAAPTSQAAVGAEVQHRCDTAPAVAEIDRFDGVRARPRDGRGRAGSTYVDPEDIAHRTPSLRSVARFAQAL